MNNPNPHATATTPSPLQTRTVKELQCICRRLGLKTRGRRADLIARIQLEEPHLPSIIGSSSVPSIIHRVPMDLIRIVRGYTPIASLYGAARWFLDMRRPLEPAVRLTAAGSVQFATRAEFRARLLGAHDRVAATFVGADWLTDVRALGGVHTLTLSKCPNVTDVRALGGVHTLTLSKCLNVTDVRALGGVHYLDISDCCNITDVRALSGVHTLIMDMCVNARGVDALTGVRALNMCGCDRAALPPPPGRLLSLAIRWTRSLVDVRPLRGVRYLDISHCSGVTDVSALGGVHTLFARNCRGITDVRALGGVHDLDLTGTGVTDVRALGGVHTLSLINTRVTDVSALGGVHTLNLAMCPHVTDVRALGNVHTLNLTMCPVTDVSALGGARMHTLKLVDCHHVTDVSALSGVHTLDLTGCSATDASVRALGGVANLVRHATAWVTYPSRSLPLQPPPCGGPAVHE